MNLVKKVLAGTVAAICASSAFGGPIVQIDWNGTSAGTTDGTWTVFDNLVGDSNPVAGDVLATQFIADFGNVTVGRGFTDGDPGAHLSVIVNGNLGSETGTLTVTYGDTGFTGNDVKHFYSDFSDPGLNVGVASLYVTLDDCDFTSVGCAKTLIWSGTDSSALTQYDLTNYASYGLVLEQSYDLSGTFGGSGDFDVTVSEPGTLALLGLGLAGFGAARRRKA